MDYLRLPEDQYVISWELQSGPGRILDGGSFFSEATGKAVIGFRASCFSNPITDEINITIIQKDPAIPGEPVEDDKGTGSDDVNRFSLSLAIILAISILIIAAFLLSWSFSRLDIDNRLNFDGDPIDNDTPDGVQVPIEEFEGPQTETISDSMCDTSYPELEEWKTDDMLDINDILTEIDRIIQDEMKADSSPTRNNS